MASLGGEQQISTNSQPDEPVARTESREGSMERRVSKDRDEKLKIARERQNEERQRKIEELKAQAEAAQRYREQKEEERRRRIDEIRNRDSEKRLQVEERKKAIMEAEKERREYILRKNQERESRLETKKRDKNSIGFAFGSSTPRLLEPADFGMVSSSTFWGQRRSTSISNVAGASLSRRSSERELADSGSKKRATSASGTERHDDHRRKTSSMYEVFNWGYSNDEPPKRFSLSIVGSEINIDEPPNTTSRSHKLSSEHRQNSNHLTATTKHFSTNDDTVDTSHIIFRSVARRKTDLMPTIPSPRDGHYGSRSSLSQTPRTPGRSYSMNRLDQLAQPIRRNGEHIRAILERQRREQLDMLDETESLGGGRRIARKSNTGGAAGGASNKDTMSRSMSHLAGVSSGGRKYNLGGGISSSFRPLSTGNKDSCKSMTHLTHSWLSTPPRSNLGLQTTATKKYLQSSFASSSTKRGQHFTTNTYRYDPNSLLLMSSSFVTAGSRSGNVTPGGSISTSRPGSAMSTSTNFSTSGYVNRRTAPVRKPRPASIAGTGVSLEELGKLKKENKPPVKSSSPLSAQTTPKRTSNMMSTSLIVTSSPSRLSSAEKKTPSKKDLSVPKPTTSKPLSKTASTDRLNKVNNKEQKPKDLSSSMTKSSIVTSSVVSAEKPISSDQAIVEAAKLDLETNDSATPAKTKDEKNALNTVKTEDMIEATAYVEKPLVDDVVVKAREDVNVKVAVTDEKIDQGNEKDANAVSTTVPKIENSNSAITKENSEVRELTPQSLTVEGGDMTASMIAKSKITTEEEAKAALAERRRLAREEAERQAELERQRIEAERLAEIKRQEEEVERQRQFEEEAIRLAAEQRKSEEERLRQAIEEAKQREEEERLKREEEEKQRIEREEAEKKAKEEAEKQRLEVAERLKREEKEREERRKRVEAIMSRTRKAGNSGTPNSTPVKENNENKIVSNEQNQQNAQSTLTTTTIIATTQNNSSSNDDSNSTSGSTTSATTPTIAPNTVAEPQNSQAMYEQSVIDKEALLMKGLSSTVIDENTKNLQQQQQVSQQHSQSVEITNGKLHSDFPNNEVLLQNTNISSVANGNGHIENINNKNELNILQDVVAPAANQLIDLSIESQGEINNTVNFNNNNSLLSTTNTLVTADSHENTDLSLL